MKSICISNNEVTYLFYDQTKTYDAVTEKFMDFSFEKTHSAYMLFYERCDPNEKDLLAQTPNIELSQELADWIWHDNIQFLHDKHVFDTTYFNFMWLICSNIPPSVPESNEVVLSNVQLGNYAFCLVLGSISAGEGARVGQRKSITGRGRNGSMRTQRCFQLSLVSSLFSGAA